MSTNSVYSDSFCLIVLDLGNVRAGGDCISKKLGEQQVDGLEFMQTLCQALNQKKKSWLRGSHLPTDKILLGKNLRMMWKRDGKLCCRAKPSSQQRIWHCLGFSLFSSPFFPIYY